MFDEEKLYETMEIDGINYANVARSKDIVEGKGYQFIFQEDYDLQIAVIRFESKLYCFHNICPHRHADKIHEGIIDKKNKTLTCPLHGWTYTLETGENTNKHQGIKHLVKFSIFEEDGLVWAEIPSDRLIPAWRKNSI